MLQTALHKIKSETAAKAHGIYNGKICTGGNRIGVTAVKIPNAPSGAVKRYRLPLSLPPQSSLIIPLRTGAANAKATLTPKISGSSAAVPNIPHKTGKYTAPTVTARLISTDRISLGLDR